MTSLRDESGTFLLSHYGSEGGLALAFRGDRSFRERCYNWAYNCGATNGALHPFYEESGNFSYICIKDVATLNKALVLQFANEIRLAKEVPLLQDSWDEDTGAVIEYNEPAIDRLARQRADSFLADKIVLENFQYRHITTCAPIYGLGVSRGEGTDD